jgi:SAM-dependent methyltransferase
VRYNDWAAQVHTEKGPSVPSYDLIAGLYDDDMGRNNDGKDISFYEDCAAGASGPVLELACGTGRISLPLVMRGFQVHALDASLPMLRELSRKAEVQLSDEEKSRLYIYWKDMRDWDLGTKFSLIVCAYSALTYLVEERDQVAMLTRARSHLARGGLFVLDTFIPHYELLLHPDNHVYFDYHRPVNGSIILERYKTIQKDLTRQVNVITRTYRMLAPDGSLKGTIVTKERIRYFFRQELVTLLQSTGFDVLAQYGGFERHAYDYRESTMVFVCRRKAAGSRQPAVGSPP